MLNAGCTGFYVERVGNVAASGKRHYHDTRNNKIQCPLRRAIDVTNISDPAEIYLSAVPKTYNEPKYGMSLSMVSYRTTLYTGICTCCD